MNIKINLKEDFINLLKLEMDSFKIEYDSFESIEYQYLNYSRKRKIPTVKRVYHTPKLFAFYKYKNEINEIIKSLEQNRDLTFRLSLLSTNSKKRDKMLDFFNIYHFHLGNKPHKKNELFVERTGDLLFVYFYENEAYILGVFPHPEEWLENNWFQIVYNNWPDLCSKFELYGITGDDDFSREEIVELRKNGINTAVYMNGKSYIPLSFGVATSGARIEDTRLIDKTYILLEDLETRLINDLESHLKEHLSKKIYTDFFSSKGDVSIKIKSLEDYNITLSIKNPIMCLEITYQNFFK